MAPLHGTETARAGSERSSPRTRTQAWGASPSFMSPKALGEDVAPPRQTMRFRGASPSFTGSQTAETAGRCHRLGAVSTVAAGPSLFPGLGAVSPSLHSSHSSLGPTGQCGGYGRPEVKTFDPHPMMHLCRNTRCAWAGEGGGIASPGVGWATGRPGEPSLPATPRWSPPCTIVAPPRWPARDGARDPATQPPRLDWVAPQIAC